MDRDLPEESKKQESRRRWIWIGVVALVFVGAVWTLRAGLSNSVQKADIRVAAAEIGNVENTLTSSGEIQPDFEAVITSPITAIIQQTYLDAGASVKAGDKILELDKEFTQLNLDKLKDELKRNGIVKLGWELEKSFYDLKINDSIKVLKINSLRAEIENAKRLFKAGGGTRESIDQADQNLRIAQLEKRQLENDIRIKQQTMRADEIGVQIKVAIERNNHLNHFMRNFADIVRLPAPQKEQINLNDLLLNIARLMEFNARQREVNFAFELVPEPVWIHADRRQMEQVLVNVVKNALESIGKKGTVTFKTNDLPSN